MKLQICEYCKIELTRRKVGGMYICWKCFLLEKRDKTLEEIKRIENKE